MNHAFTLALVCALTSLIPAQITVSGQPGPLLPPFNPTTRQITMDGDTDGESFGQAVSDIGDINGDGIPDILVGAPFDTGFITGQRPGQSHVRSGADGSTITLPFPLNTFGAADGDEFGASVDGLPDIDGDGVADMIIGAPQGSSAFAGYARVISGGTGLIISNPAPTPGSSPNVQVGGFGYDVSDAGDVNADGVNDYIVGAPFTTVNGGQHRGMAQVYSGATGANILFTASGGALTGIYGTGTLSYTGISVGSAGDWNGDGWDDVLCGAYNPTGVGFVRVYSGRWLSTASGTSVLASLQGNGPNDGFGISCHRAGDVNGDGLGDVIVGTYFGNYCEVFTGSTTTQVNPPALYTFTRPNASGFGYAVSGGRDVDGDGTPDVIAGPGGASWLVNSRAIVFSGATGAVIRSISGPRSGYFAIALDLMPDMTGNGRAEVLVGAPYQSIGRIAPGRVTLSF